MSVSSLKRRQRVVSSVEMKHQAMMEAHHTHDKHGMQRAREKRGEKSEVNKN